MENGAYALHNYLIFLNDTYNNYSQLLPMPLTFTDLSS